MDFKAQRIDDKNDGTGLIHYVPRLSGAGQIGCAFRQERRLRFPVEAQAHDGHHFGLSRACDDDKVPGLPVFGRRCQDAGFNDFLEHCPGHRGGRILADTAACCNFFDHARSFPKNIPATV